MGRRACVSSPEILAILPIKLRIRCRARRRWLRCVRPLDKSTRLGTRPQIQEWQLERLNSVWRHAARHVPYYHDLASRQGLPLEFKSLQQYQDEVPLLSKSTICQQPKLLLSDQASPGYWKRTGGSTMT